MNNNAFFGAGSTVADALPGTVGAEACQKEYVRLKVSIRTLPPVSRKKLTLSVEERLSRRAKAIAEKRGTSVSRLVETFFTGLGEEEKEIIDGGPADQNEGEAPSPSADAGGSSSSEYTPSEWGQQWRGAFAEEGTTYPDDTAWEEEVFRSEIETKHSS